MSKLGITVIGPTKNLEAVRKKDGTKHSKIVGVVQDPITNDSDQPKSNHIGIWKVFKNGIVTHIVNGRYSPYRRWWQILTDSENQKTQE